jgi:peptidoglycan hydrolase-like protein with peptidoglycan-binding domain
MTVRTSRPRRLAVVVATVAAAFAVSVGSAAAAPAGRAYGPCPDLLREGMSSSCVGVLNAKLNAVLPAYGLNPSATYYGVYTRKAVLDFQARHGLRVDGAVGYRTKAVLLRLVPDPRPTGSTTPCVPPSNSTTNSTILPRC